MTHLAPRPADLPSRSTGNGGLPTPALGVPPAARLNPIIRFLGALKRYAWLVVLCTAIGTGAGWFLSRLRPERFDVRASMILSGGGGDAGPVDAGPVYTSDQWRDFLTSYAILEPVAIDHQLYLQARTPLGTTPLPPGPSGPHRRILETLQIDPARVVAGEYQLSISDDGRSWELTAFRSATTQKGQAGDSIGRSYGMQWAPRLLPADGGTKIDFTLLTPREAADELRSNLGIDIPWRNARFIKVSLTGQDGVVTARVLNAIMRRFTTEAALQKRVDLTQRVGVLDTQLTSAQNRLANAERELEAFRVRTVTLPKEDLPVAPGLQQTSSSGYSSFVELRRQVDQWRRDRRDLADALGRVQAGDLAVDRLAVLAPVQSSRELQAVIDELAKVESSIREQRATGLLDDWPTLATAIKRAEELRRETIPRYARAVLQRLDDQIASGERSIATSARELEAIPTRSINEARLQREVEVAEGIYENLTQRYEAARLMEASALPDVRIFDPAVAPLRPSKNRKSVILLGGLLGGLGLGLGLAFLIDLLDKRVRYAEQVSGGLGLTILGVVPEIRRAKGRTPTAEEAAQVVESFRTIRLNLAHALDATGHVLTITSPSPGDGKSLVSSNLALSFAEAGYRTLLIDGDTRRGELHRTFGFDRRPGLLDYLVGETDEASMRRATSHPQLTVIPCGTRMRNAPELLGTEKMRAFVQRMRQEFDVVLVDSPPLGAGIDPLVLATVTGAMMLVVRAGATQRDLAEAKLQVVDQLPIQLVGAVLNDLRSSATEYRYYSYSAGYGAQDEVPGSGNMMPAVLRGRVDEASTDDD